MLHVLVYDLVCALALRVNHEPTLRVVLSKHKLLPKLIAHFQENDNSSSGM